MKQSVILVIAGLAMLLGGVGLRVTEQQTAHAQTATTFAVDADLTTPCTPITVPGCVQATRPSNVTLGSNFTVDIVLTDHSAAYGSYQVTVDYDDVLFDAVGIPADWSSTPVIDTTGGSPNSPSVIWPVGGALCSGAAGSVTGEDNAGIASVAMTCAANDTNETSTYEGMLVELVFACRQLDGTGNITIHDFNDTFVLDNVNFVKLNDNAPGDGTGSVGCGAGGAGPTPTATFTPTITATPQNTNTAVPSTATRTPTKTPVPTRTPPPDTVLITPTPRSGQAGPGGVPPVGGGSPAPPTPRGGGPGGTITGPDTGTGGTGGTGSPFAMILLGAGTLFIGLGLAPIARRAVARRATRGG